MEIVNVNVSGKVFAIQNSVLKRFPNTKLGCLSQTWPEYNIEKNEFFFDRNPKVMVSVFDLYRTGELHLPENMCSFTVQNELEFWQIDKGLISECCWKKYSFAVRAKTVIDVIEKSIKDRVHITHGSFKQQMWMTMEYPMYSIFSKLWFSIYMAFVAATVIIACLYTVPHLRQPLSESNSHLEANSIIEMLFKSEMVGIIYLLDLICLAFFTAELVIKFIICPDKAQFFTFGLNILDIVLANIMWLSVILDHIPAVEHVHIAHTILRATFCLNVLRIFHLGKSSNIMKLLIFTLRASLGAFGLLLVTLTMAVVIFATVAYFAEVGTKADTFPNIPFAIWWTIVTMTTVGYGDFVPRSWAGYIVAAVCSLSGILLIAMPIAIIVSNFDKFHSNMPAAEQRIRRRMLVDGNKVIMDRMEHGGRVAPQTVYLKEEQPSARSLPYTQPSYYESRT